ncbi:hypothetical protein CMV_026791 [Castanea mollissima]|uniref:RNase H type-1 domain-containing protein n=1 Tax=Castanea mollissima TaxID=60419 RepID=A0A8J4QGI7_9ROSI|nr:hypothetical protein CMV_026791 [Castanea mollissima]
MAGSYLQEYLDTLDQTPAAAVPLLPQQWHPLDESKFKANFNAAVFKSCNQAGIGVIIWDWRGEAIGALSMLVLAAQSIVELEALACRRVMQVAMELGLQDVFEGNLLQVIQAISQEHSDHLTYGHIIEDIRNQVAALSSSNFIFNTRHCNVVTDAPAKKAKNFRETRVWIDSLLKNIVQATGGHELFEATLAAEERLPIVCGHI